MIIDKQILNLSCFCVLFRNLICKYLHLITLLANSSSEEFSNLHTYVCTLLYTVIIANLFETEYLFNVKETTTTRKVRGENSWKRRQGDHFFIIFVLENILFFIFFCSRTSQESLRRTVCHSCRNRIWTVELMCNNLNYSYLSL
jgi:hypothetical protein